MGSSKWPNDTEVTSDDSEMTLNDFTAHMANETFFHK